MAQQVAMDITGLNGARLQLGTGGYLRPLYLLRETADRACGVLGFGPRLYTAAALGWLDMRDLVGDEEIRGAALALHAGHLIKTQGFINGISVEEYTLMGDDPYAGYSDAPRGL